MSLGTPEKSAAEIMNRNMLVSNESANIDPSLVQILTLPYAAEPHYRLLVNPGSTLS